jgi:hypothetical protein
MHLGTEPRDAVHPAAMGIAGPEMEIRQRRGIADQAVVVDASDTATRHLRQP